MTRPTDILSPAEIKLFNKKQALFGAWDVLVSWAMIFGCFALVYWVPTWWMAVIAILLLGGRQLALNILMHDAAHDAIFPSKKMNRFVGQWLCAYPVLQDLERYRDHHLRHHRFAGSEKDPDVSLVKDFPITKASMVRKFFRDIIGITGWKRLYGILLMNLGYVKYTVAAEVIKDKTPRRFFDRLILAGRRFVGPVFCNALLFAGAILVGAPWLYGLWVIAYLTSFSVFIRVRSIAEHAMTEMDLDPVKNTRTTKADWLARVTVAPHHVNYHLEHHLMMSVPSYKLKALHHRLRQQGLYDEKARYGGSYWSILKSSTR